jgi:hypothetical protein
VEDMFASLKEKQEDGPNATIKSTTTTVVVSPEQETKATVLLPASTPKNSKPKLIRKRTAVNVQTTIAEISLTEEDTEEELSSSVVIDPSVQQEESPITVLKTLEDSD